MTSNLPTISPDEIPFDQMLAYALAENRVAMLNKPWTEEELCEQFDITIDVLQQLKQSKKFAKAVTMAVSELKKGSGAIETKAKSLFEMYTDTWVPQVMSNPDAMLSEKVKIYTLLGKTGKVLQENAKAAEGAQTVVPQFNLYLTQAPVVQPTMKDIVDVN